MQALYQLRPIQNGLRSKIETTGFWGGGQRRAAIMRGLLAGMVVLLGCFGVVEAAEEKGAEARETLKRVALFKNGLGYFISDLTVSGGSDRYRLNPEVAATHGTYWVSYGAHVPLASMRVREVEVEKSHPAVSIPDLLRANVGRRVQIVQSIGQEIKQYTGVIRDITDMPQAPRPEPYRPGRVSPRPWERYQQETLVLEDNRGIILIRPSSVVEARVLDKEMERTFTYKEKGMELELVFSRSVGRTKMGLSYLAKGITWVPSYMVDIGEGDRTARLSAKATIVNEACDLKGVRVELITGYPHLQFSDVVSPLAMKEDLAAFLRALMQGESRRDSSGVMSNVMRQSASVYGGMGGRYGGEARLPMPAYGTAEKGQMTEDLFFYPVEKVSLKKGETGYYPLFTEAVAYEHIYIWDIPDYINEQDRYVYNERNREQKEKGMEVWHCVRLENTMKIPWTTAPAETVSEGLILGQDTLHYTPAGGESTLRITRAASVKAEQIEWETARKRDALQMYGYHYDLVTIEGKLQVKNFLAKQVRMEINKLLSGEEKSSDPKAEVTKPASGLKLMNGKKKLTWEIDLKAGEEKTMSYIYDVYVRR